MENKLINLNHKWCTYITTHPTGIFYEGKGITSKVFSGAYKGSGIRFKLALTHAGFEVETWTTVILDTYQDEAAAYAAEALLVPLSSLSDPLRLNMSAGGQVLRQNHSLLFKKQNADKKRVRVAIKRERAAIKKQLTTDKIASLKKQLKEKK